MKYFTIEELCKSQVASTKVINNLPTKDITLNLTNLVLKILDPLREKYGKPIIVNSGYRCSELNKAVGGSKTSDHQYGLAADITGGSKTENKKLFQLVQQLCLPFDQLINEQDYSWVHVSYRPNPRRQILNL